MLFGPGYKDQAVYVSRQTVNDFRGIIQHLGVPFTPADATAEFHESVAWLRQVLATPWDGRTVVLTHHAPSIQSVSDEFRNDFASAAFASNLENLIASHDIDLWVHGHTHRCFDYKLGNTRVICNPRGYPHEQNNFNPNLVVEI